MGYGGWMDWALAILLLGVSALLFMGKGDFILMGGRQKNKERLEKEYDYPKLKLVAGTMTLLLGMIELLMAVAGDKVSSLPHIYLPLVLCVFVGGIVCFQKCKRKK